MISERINPGEALGKSAGHLLGVLQGHGGEEYQYLDSSCRKDSQSGAEDHGRLSPLPGHL